MSINLVPSCKTLLLLVLVFVTKISQLQLLIQSSVFCLRCYTYIIRSAILCVYDRVPTIEYCLIAGTKCRDVESAGSDSAAGNPRRHQLCRYRVTVSLIMFFDNHRSYHRCIVARRVWWFDTHGVVLRPRTVGFCMHISHLGMRDSPLTRSQWNIRFGKRYSFSFAVAVTDNKTKTSNSAIAERPRCRVG